MTYDWGLVGLSFAVATFASLTALDLAGRVRASAGIAAKLWLAGGAFAMGIGIWSMHFIGMLAMEMATTVAYDIPLTLISLGAAILSSLLALTIIQSGSHQWHRLILGASVMGAGICIMHYVGMEAMIINGDLAYRPWPFVASVFIALSSATIALWLGLRLNPAAQFQRPPFSYRALSAAVMAIGITGMHYTGMAATIFPEQAFVQTPNGLSPHRLAISVALVAGCILLAAMLISVFDAHLSSRNAQLAHSLKKANKQLKSMVYRDALTQLPNRLMLEDRLEQLLQENYPQFFVFFVDLDHFKAVNDTKGHHIGDRLIQQAAERLRAAVRQADMVARVGGDEFIVLMQDDPSLANAEVLAKRIVATLEQPFQVDEHILKVSSSVGICAYPEDAQDKHDLMVFADAAMYAAKQSGRNTYLFYQADMTSELQRRNILDQRLRHALANDGLSLAYQPKVAVDTGEVSGVEALLRWHDDELGPVRPDEVIPFAEDSGLILPLGEWVLKTACQFAQQWQQENQQELAIAVNISAIQLGSRSFVQTVTQTLKETGLKPQLLELEVTESALISDPNNALLILNRLRELGVAISIDDFGTGYSNLAQLRRLPIDRLKIDRSFITEAVSNAQDAAIVKSVIALANNLNLQVTTEGIENEEQLEFIRSLKGHEYQGYYYSKAVSAEDLKTLLATDGHLKEAAV